jgi:hypothetical protein
MTKTDIRIIINNLTKLKDYFYKIKQPLISEELEYMKGLIVQQDKECKKLRLDYLKADGLVKKFIKMSEESKGLRS